MQGERDTNDQSVSKCFISLCVNLYSYILHQFFNPLECYIYTYTYTYNIYKMLYLYTEQLAYKKNTMPGPQR